MACPKCGCKVTYTINGIDDADDGYGQERCESCGAVFFLVDAPDDDDDPTDRKATWDAMGH